jgi:hypothetical protein
VINEPFTVEKSSITIHSSPSMRIFFIKDKKKIVIPYGFDRFTVDSFLNIEINVVNGDFEKISEVYPFMIPLTEDNNERIDGIIIKTKDGKIFIVSSDRIPRKKMKNLFYSGGVLYSLGDEVSKDELQNLKDKFFIIQSQKLIHNPKSVEDEMHSNTLVKNEIVNKAKNKDNKITAFIENKFENFNSISDVKKHIVLGFKIFQTKNIPTLTSGIRLKDKKELGDFESYLRLVSTIYMSITKNFSEYVYPSQYYLSMTVKSLC